MTFLINVACYALSFNAMNVFVTRYKVPTRAIVSRASEEEKTNCRTKATALERPEKFLYEAFSIREAFSIFFLLFEGRGRHQLTDAEPHPAAADDFHPTNNRNEAMYGHLVQQTDTILLDPRIYRSVHI